MEPRELDALVAEKVMEATVVTQEEFDTWEYTLAKKSGNIKRMTKEQQRARFWRRVKRINGEPVPFYSTDRAACGKMLDVVLAGENADLFVMYLMDLYEGPELYCAVDNHVALARLLQDPEKCCKAALKALGIPIEGGE